SVPQSYIRSLCSFEICPAIVIEYAIPFFALGVDDVSVSKRQYSNTDRAVVINLRVYSSELKRRELTVKGSFPFSAIY
ncbi:hypothetical protein OFC05_30685, partial [Escherichia coli]|nr:hypothetical protein [Escherichia coli]